MICKKSLHHQLRRFDTLLQALPKTAPTR